MWNYINNAPLDMNLYLILLTLLPFTMFINSKSDDVLQAKVIYMIQAFFTCLFIFAWGGFSADAPIYSEYFSWFLSTIKGVDIYFVMSYPFYLIGTILNELIYPPWPLKIMMGSAVFIYSLGLYKICKRISMYHANIALLALLLMPSYYLLFGNAIRQGFAASIVVLGFAYLLDRKYVVFIALVFFTYFIHSSSIAFAVAFLMIKLPIKWVKILLLLSPISLLSYESLFGSSPIYIPYAGRKEGIYHFERFILEYALAWMTILLYPNLQTKYKQLALAYPIMVAISSIFLFYEIAFERLVGYADLLLPITISIILLNYRHILQATLFKQTIIILIVLATGLLLWNHPSVVFTLGYT